MRFFKKPASLALMLALLLLTACGKDECDHVFGEYVIRREGSCIESEIAERFCEKCGEVEEIRTPSSEFDHDFYDDEILIPATCSTHGEGERVCSICGERELFTIEPDESKHSLGPLIVITPATEQEDGEGVRVCTECSSSVTEVIPKTSGN